MLPTLAGRIQTRLFLLATVGAVVSLFVAAVIDAGAPLSVKVGNVFAILATVAVLGFGWDCIYQLLMQWRWEKDWPSLFGLLTFLNEGIVVYLLARGGAIPGVRRYRHHTLMPFGFFWVDFVLVWVAVWVAASGPMRVPFLRWRFLGGRLL